VPRPSRIDLVMPGLFGPVPVHPHDLPPTPVLGRLIGRADTWSLPAIGPDQTLFDCFGVDREPARDAPSGPYCRLADLPGAEPSGYVLHADPVHLRPDRDRLLLFDARHLDLTQRESAALVGLFNRHFAEDGLWLEAGAAQRWYLRVERAPLLRATPLHEAVGRDIRPLLPSGPDARAWMRTINEAQMLFHHAETNRVRERAGRPSVSGIWPWGGGSLPAARPQVDIVQVFGTHALAVGLAAFAGVPVRPVPEDARDLLAWGEKGAVLAYADDLWRPVLDADGRAWLAALRRLEGWLAGLVEGHRPREMRLNLYPCDGRCYGSSSRSLRRFWRRPAALSDRLQRPARA
jgi:hypothetical protein